MVRHGVLSGVVPRERESHVALELLEKGGEVPHARANALSRVVPVGDAEPHGRARHELHEAAAPFRDTARGLKLDSTSMTLLTSAASTPAARDSLAIAMSYGDGVLRFSTR